MCSVFLIFGFPSCPLHCQRFKSSFSRKFLLEIKFFSASPRLRGATNFYGFSERSECVVKVLVFLCGLRVLCGEWVWLWLCPAAVKGAFSVPYKNSQFQSLSISVDQSKSVASVLRVLVAAQLLSTKFFDDFLAFLRIANFYRHQIPLRASAPPRCNWFSPVFLRVSVP